MQAVLSRQATGESNSKIQTKIGINLKYLIAFFALRIVAGELHEQAHITIGRIVCGAYGARNFSVWQTAEKCAKPSLSILATCAGPLFTYLVVWCGVYLLTKAKTDEYKSLGFALIFAPLPFARIFTSLMGGGDEKVVFNYFFNDYLNLLTIKILAAIFVTAICLPPILYAGRSIASPRRRLYVAGFCVVPLIVLSFYQWIFNYLLEKGFLADQLILGTPTLILLHFLLMTAILVILFRNLLRLKVSD